MAVSQPGSRAGLITTLVIFVVLFFVAAIFAAVKYSESERRRVEFEQMQRQYNTVISRGDAATVSGTIETLRSQAGMPGRTYYEIVTQQQKDLIRLLAGADVTPRVARERFDQLISTANTRLAGAGQVASGSAQDAIKSLLDLAQQQLDNLAAREAQIRDLEARMNEARRVHEAALAESQKGRNAALDAAAAAARSVADYRRQKDSEIANLESTVRDRIESAQRQVTELSNQLAEANKQLETLRKERRQLVARLDRVRPVSIAELIMRQADGRVTRVDRSGTVYINLHAGQQIIPGMTFQVYDRNQGVPPTPPDGLDSEAEMPVGKGSIEVIAVGPLYSECRIIRRTPGENIYEGDIVANLAYDKNVRWKFRIYGNFDLDQNGMATAAERVQIERLVTQWGALVVDDVTPDTDFVVLGKEPIIPVPEDDSPVSLYEVELAEAALKAYQAVRDKALDLNIPVLNQNRFLYLIGYFEQGQR